MTGANEDRAYVKEVRTRFQNDKQVYGSFLTMLKEYKDQR